MREPCARYQRARLLSLRCASRVSIKSPSAPLVLSAGPSAAARDAGAVRGAAMGPITTRAAAVELPPLPLPPPPGANAGCPGNARLSAIDGACCIGATADWLCRGARTRAGSPDAVGAGGDGFPLAKSRPSLHLPPVPVGSSGSRALLSYGFLW